MGQKLLSIDALRSRTANLIALAWDSMAQRFVPRGLQASPDGALYTANVGLPGQIAAYTLDANTAAGSGDGATEHMSSVTGWQAFTLDLINPITISADQALMVAWSTDAGDEATLTAVLDSLRTALGTPDATGITNCIAITDPVRIPTIYAADGIRIKTISVASQGTTAYDVAVRGVI